MEYRRCQPPCARFIASDDPHSNGAFPLHGTARCGSVLFTFGGFFHWVLYLVPGTFLVPPRPRFQAIRMLPKRDV